jgi:hypothetical protein
MNKTTTRSTTHLECCTELECESGLRNNYFEGKRLTADSFRVEQAYMLERRRLLNRAIHGWGVVYGYAITPSQPAKGMGQGRLKIGAGLALDKCGRELLQTETPIEVADLLVLDQNGKRIDPENAFSDVGSSNRRAASQSQRWLLSVHYAERDTDHVTIKDPCSCEHREWDHTCETVRYSLQPADDAECCKDFECELECDCKNGPCCDEPANTDDKYQRPAPTKPHKRGGCRCLCEHLTQLAPGAGCGSLCEIEEACGSVRVDLRNGVPLACVDLVRDECDRWTFGEEVEACGPRRLVKRNDLLFDLIRGCDLTRISEISWKEWHRDAITFEAFDGAFGPEMYRQAEYVTNFSVTFSRPVGQGTLLPDCFAMTVMCREREGNWWQTFRVPIVRLEYIPGVTRDPIDHVRGAKIVVAGDWVEDGLRGRGSVFNDYETRVEIEVRGDFIVDCNGQTVDANTIGLSSVPTGNGTPGGVFLSTFLVAQRAPQARTGLNDSGDRLEGVS